MINSIYSLPLSGKLSSLVHLNLGGNKIQGLILNFSTDKVKKT